MSHFVTNVSTNLNCVNLLKRFHSYDFLKRWFPAAYVIRPFLLSYTVTVLHVMKEGRGEGSEILEKGRIT